MKNNILLSLIAAALAGCTPRAARQAPGADSIAPGNALTGNRQIEKIIANDSVSIQPRETTPGVAQTITFAPDGFYIIATNCNSINGSYTLCGTSLRMTDGLMTEMACDNMAVENHLCHIIPQINSVDFENDSTIRLNTGGTPCIILRK